MPLDRGPVAAPAALHRVRAHRLLRQFAGEARDGTLPHELAPDHPVVRARRGLVLLLSRRPRIRDRAPRTEPVTPLTGPVAAVSPPPCSTGPARPEAAGPVRAARRPAA